MQPIGMASPTSRPPRPGCSPAARKYCFRALTSGGSNQRRKLMPVPPVVVDVGDVDLCLFLVGVERLKLARRCVAVERHPQAPARGYQQPLALAGLVDADRKSVV